MVVYTSSYIFRRGEPDSSFADALTATYQSLREEHLRKGAALLSLFTRVYEEGDISLVLAGPADFEGRSEQEATEAIPDLEGYEKHPVWSVADLPRELGYS